MVASTPLTNIIPPSHLPRQDISLYSTSTSTKTAPPASPTQNMTTSLRHEPTPSSPLLRLPTEIRITIYLLVLLSPTPISRPRSTHALFPRKRRHSSGPPPRTWEHPRPSTSTSTSTTLSLALTSRQIYRETSGPYYSLNAFSLNLLDFALFSSDLRAPNLARITILHCVVPAECAPATLVSVFRLASLQRLHLSLDRSISPSSVEHSPWAVGKWWQVAKALEEVRMTFAGAAELEYRWGFEEGRVTRRVYCKGAEPP